MARLGQDGWLASHRRHPEGAARWLRRVDLALEDEGDVVDHGQRLGRLVHVGDAGGGVDDERCERFGDNPAVQFDKIVGLAQDFLVKVVRLDARDEQTCTGR